MNREVIAPSCFVLWRRQLTPVLSLLALCTLVAALDSPAVAETDDLERRTSWSPATPDAVRERLDGFLASSELSDVVRDRAMATWDQSSATEGAGLLERVVAALAVVDERVQPIRSVCAAPRVSSLPTTFAWLFADETDRFLSDNVRLLYARWLTQHAFYDEALQYLADLELTAVADPAGLLFYRSVVNHRLLKKQDCLRDLATLLENAEAVPTRFAALARLMDADLRPLEEDSLDEVARLMEDIQRRLKFGRAGTRVRQEEDDVIAKLDKMIEEIEKQQQQQQQSSGGGAQGSQPNNPAQQSGNLPGKGPGDVDQKPIGDKSGWGNLPPKERQQALQQISKDLPSHFREVIEEYFRKLARESE